MLPGIKCICRQTVANYRKPSSLQIRESFPLPPYSTVIGMVHAACGFKDYQPMRVSVQGRSQSVAQDLYIRYELMSFDKSDLSRHTYGIAYNDADFALCANDKQPVYGEWDDWDKTGVNRGTGLAELLIDVELVLHIVPEDPALVPVILAGLRQPPTYLALGRHEDLLQIENVKMVQLKEEEVGRRFLQYDAYVPLRYFEEPEKESMGTVYRLRKEYNGIDSATGLRNWGDFIEAAYVPHFAALAEDMLTNIDEDGVMAFLA